MVDKRKVVWMFITLLIAICTIYAVLSQSRDLSISAVISVLSQASLPWLILTFLCMTGFILFEALSLLAILKGFGYRRSFHQGLVYSAGDIYFSAITPSASGGQPASIFFMRQDKVPAAVITVTLLVNLIMYTLAVVSIGIVCLLFRPGVFMRFSIYSKALILFGMVTLSLLTVLFIGLLKKGSVLFDIGKAFFMFFHRIHLMKNPDRYIERLKRMVEQYGMCQKAIIGKKKVLWKVYIYNLLQRISQISVAMTLHIALKGLQIGAAADLWAVQAFCQIGSNCVPIPGGMGAADYLMLDGFGFLFKGSYIYQLQILSRGISFYVCTLISGVIVFAGYLIRRYEGNRKVGK